jgi:hypothetical protein
MTFYFMSCIEWFLHLLPGLVEFGTTVLHWAMGMEAYVGSLAYGLLVF